jgi:hypothetical protein
MAYVSYDHAPSTGTMSRIKGSRLDWSRPAMIAACAAFWLGVAFVIRLIF